MRHPLTHLAIWLIPACAAALGIHSGCAIAAEDAQTVSPARGAAPVQFGDAIPSEHFVHEFQRQIVQQLQNTIAQASREQNERLQRFEEQQNRKLSEQTDALRRALDELRSHPAAAGSDTPHVNFRRSQESAAPDRAEGVSETRAAPPAPLAAASMTALTPFATRSPTLAIGANLSPHGFVEGRLLNGVVAVVGGPERESIVALTGRYQAANGFLTDLDGCFALVQGRPDLAAGRIDFKVSRLTCNFPDGASKTWDLSGWLVDRDGIRGLRATIVQNVGRKALVATAGGALAGFGQRLSQQQYQVNSSPIGSSASFIGNATRDAVGGSATGAANAMGQSIADYYNLYAPSLQVGGGTPVTLIIANELKLPTSAVRLTQTHVAQP